MPSKDTKILQFNQYQKPDKATFTIYADLESTIEKIHGCKNNPRKSSTTNVGKHISSGFSMSTISLFRGMEDKHDECRSRDCVKKFANS